MIAADSVAVAGARVTATVSNKEDANGTFSLVLTAYDGILRLYINEAPEKKRFEVPDVLIPGLEQREQVRPRPPPPRRAHAPGLRHLSLPPNTLQLAGIP